MPVLTKAKFIFGFEHAGSGTETPPALNAFASARGEKDRALFPLPPAFNSLAAHSFKKRIAGIWWVLGFHCVALQSALIQPGCTAQPSSSKADTKVLTEIGCSNAMLLYMQFSNV